LNKFCLKKQKMKTQSKKLKRLNLEKSLVTLKKIKCSLKVKKKLRKAARDWIKFIKQHISDIHRDGFFKEYHLGEIAFIELFFNIKNNDKKPIKNIKEKLDKKKLKGYLRAYPKTNKKESRGFSLI